MVLLKVFTAGNDDDEELTFMESKESRACEAEREAKDSDTQQ